MPAGQPTLVPYDARHIEPLIPMWRASFEAGVGIVDPHPLADQRQYFLREVLPHNRVRLALLGDELVGFVAASAQSIAQLYVRVGFQRQGIGARLLHWAKEQSSGSLELYTFARNAGARAFYERNGFVAVAHGFEPHWQLDDVKYQWIRVEAR
jgi:GNAT superfamily N-acetyltransferase